jgi:hypothetical protein
MTAHAYKVGQTVRILTSTIHPGVAGAYRILALLPEEHGDRQYRVQSTSSDQQRVIWESQIAESAWPPAAQALA